MRKAAAVAVLIFQAGVLSAQLLPEQRVFDFQNLAALYAKRYAPYEWKKAALGFDLLDLKPWLDRVRAARDDLEFYEIEAEYVANLQDTHSNVFMTSSFRADLGITVDIYDNLVLIDAINRAVLRASEFPFAIGDELVSLDGKSVEEWITIISKFRKYGNPVTTRRNAAGLITQRSQSSYPRASELGDTATVVIRRANGDLETYKLPWTKTGVPVAKAGPIPMPRAAAAQSRSGMATVEDLTRLQEEMHTWKLPYYDPILQPIEWAVDAAGERRTFVSGVGSRTPLFRAGLPASFTQRLGNNTSDFHFSGTYTSGGQTIGYLRVPSFSPASTANAVRELEAEVTYMQRNTDGLVIDVMRNPGGDAMAVGGVLGLVQQALPLGIGGEHGLQQALRPFRRLLRDAADPRPVGQPDLAGIGVQVAGDQLQEGGLAGAVAPDQAGLVAAGQAHAGALEKRAPGDPAGQVGDG